MEKQPCVTCDGNGTSIFNKPGEFNKDCEDCQGRGYTVLLGELCDFCKGTGKKDGEHCYICRGTGRYLDLTELELLDKFAAQAVQVLIARNDDITRHTASIVAYAVAVEMFLTREDLLNKRVF